MKYLKIKESDLLELVDNIDKIFSFYDINPIRQFSDAVAGNKVKDMFKLVNYLNYEVVHINYCKKIIKEITS